MESKGGYFPQASSSATTHKPPQFVEDRNVRLSFAFRSRFLGSCAPNPWEQPLLALPYGPDRPGIPRKQSSPAGDARRDYHIASGIWVECSAHDSEILVSPSCLL